MKRAPIFGKFHVRTSFLHIGVSIKAALAYVVIEHRGLLFWLVPCVKPIIDSSYMPWNNSVTPKTCVRCLYGQSRVSHPSVRGYHALRASSTSSASPQHGGQPVAGSKSQASEGTFNGAAINTEQRGAMSRRLADMTDKTIEQGGRGAQKAIQESGFSVELKKRLEARIIDSRFKSENPAAFAQISMPVC